MFVTTTVADSPIIVLRDKQDFGLVPVGVDTWDGQVFVNLDANAPPLATTVRGVTERIAPVRLADLRFSGRVDYVADCNWKVYVDNYLEGYHVPYGIREGDRAFYFFLFPNFMLNILPGRLQTNLVVPLGPDRTRVEFRYFHAHTEGAEARRLIEEDIEFSDRVQREDLDICGHVQLGIATRR